MEPKDLVIGAVTKYNWDSVKYWVNSLEQSGYSGDKLMVVFEAEDDLLLKLQEKGFMLYQADPNPSGNIVVDRFFYFWDVVNNLMQDNDYRYIITTDVKDVIFQTNPSEYLEDFLVECHLVASSESIKYKDEIWGRNNISEAFGALVYEQMKDNVIYNAGVIAGKPFAMRDLFLQLYLICANMNPHVRGGGGPDQAAYNILLNSAVYKNNTLKLGTEFEWAAQLGTTMDPRKMHIYRDLLVEDPPIIKNNIVCNPKGRPYCIVHQYDRVPQLKTYIEEKYA